MGGVRKRPSFVKRFNSFKLLLIVFIYKHIEFNLPCKNTNIIDGSLLNEAHFVVPKNEKKNKKTKKPKTIIIGPNSWLLKYGACCCHQKGLCYHPHHHHKHYFLFCNIYLFVRMCLIHLLSHFSRTTTACLTPTVVHLMLLALLLLFSGTAAAAAVQILNISL